MEDSLYDRPPAQIVWQDESGVMEIRASQADICDRMLYYSANETEPSDDIPVDSMVLMKMGKLLEGFVKETLADKHGWQFPDAAEPRVLRVLRGELAFTGIPDWVGRCLRTDGRDTVLEIKTRSDFHYRNTVRRGAWVAQRGAVIQLAVYRRVLVSEGVISPDVDCCVATLNRDTAMIYQEWFRPDALDEVLDLMFRSKADMLDTFSEGVPEPELDPDSFQCASCKWRTHCGNIRVAGRTAGVVGEADAARAIRAFEPAKLAERENRVSKDLDKEVRQSLLAFMQDNRLERMPFMGADYWWNVFYRKNDKTVLDEQKVRYLLGPVEFESCMTELAGDPSVEIRRGKRS